MIFSEYISFLESIDTTKGGKHGGKENINVGW
jgi:hypothetical protein